MTILGRAQEENRAEIVTTNTQTGKVTEGNYPYLIDGDGDPKIAIGDFRLVFRFLITLTRAQGTTSLDPDQPGRVPVSPSAQPTDGLRRGDLSDTPFRIHLQTTFHHELLPVARICAR